MTAAQRKAMPASQFALPTNRAFPVNDAPHARLAISGAARAENAGNLTAGQKSTIVAKAKAKLQGDSMKKDMPTKKIATDSGTETKPSIPTMPHGNKTGFKPGMMNQKPAMGGAHKIGKGFDDHEKCAY